jgi:ABC-2 type transport system permease protein
MMGMFLFQSALAEYMRLRRTLVWLFVAAGICGAAFIWTNVIAGIAPKEAYSEMSLIMVYRMLPLVAAIFSTAVITQEIAQKTIVYLVTRPVSRMALIVARIAAASVVVFIVGAVCALAVSIGVFGPRNCLNGAVLRDLPALALGSAAYVSFFTLLSLWANKAMLVCLLYAFGWETLVVSMPGDLYYMSIYSYLSVLGAKPSLEGGNAPMLQFLAGQLGTNTMTSRTALPMLLLVIAVCVVVAAVWFANFEYVPREDTD